MHSFIYHRWHLAVLLLSSSHLKRTHFSHQKSRCDFCVRGVVILPFTNGISVRIFLGLRSLVSPISASPFCTALSFFLNMDVIGGTEGSSDALPLENTPFLSCCQLWAGLYLTYLLHLPSPPPLYVHHTYLLPPSHIAVFLFIFLFSACATMVKDNISTANPASFLLYYHADTFLCACTLDVAHAYIWPQLNNVNACEQKSFV